MDSSKIVPFSRHNDPEGAQQIRDAILWCLWEDNIRSKQRRRCVFWVIGTVLAAGGIMSLFKPIFAPKPVASVPPPILVIREPSTAAPAPSPSPGGGYFYVVTKRDKLLRIAPQVPMSAKLACNPNITDEDHIEIGQRIGIPSFENDCWVCPRSSTASVVSSGRWRDR